MNKDEKEKLYTVRWLVREKWGEASAQDEVIELLGDLLDPASTPQERPSVSQPAQKLLWCPFAEKGFPAGKTRGSYARGYPVGAIVHFTAGRRSGLAAGMEEQVRNKYLYFVIDAEGKIGQNFSLDSWGYHAGPSSYPGLGEGVSTHLVGIEIQAAGMLTKTGSTFKTWFGESVPASEVRTIARKTENQQPGPYQKYTAAQEASLLRLLRWLKSNNPEVFQFKYVLGHDEVSPGRKNDPGGALSMTMPDLRLELEKVG
jgi:hypothetical protein